MGNLSGSPSCPAQPAQGPRACLLLFFKMFTYSFGCGMQDRYCVLCPPLSPVSPQPWQPDGACSFPSPRAQEAAPGLNLIPCLPRGPFFFRVWGTARSHEFNSDLIKLGFGRQTPLLLKSSQDSSLVRGKAGQSKSRTGTDNLGKVYLNSANVFWETAASRKPSLQASPLWQIPARRGRCLLHL